ncbi:hypothetical protein X975_22938, partial [Stegodyphus mimosarum]
MLINCHCKFGCQCPDLHRLPIKFPCPPWGHLPAWRRLGSLDTMI